MNISGPATITLSYKGYGKVIEHTLSGDEVWPELMTEFRNFLCGVGYFVPYGEWLPEDDSRDCEL